MGESSSVEQKKLSRRNFLGELAKTVGLSSLLIFLKGDTHRSPDPVTNPLPKTVQEIESIDEILTFTGNGVRVWGDSKTNRPIRWEDAKGNKGVFDKGILESAEKEVLMTGKRRSILTTFVERSNPTDIKIENYAKKEGIITRPPEDVVGVEELELRGITITSSHHIGLSFRPGVFDEGGPLDQYVKEGNKRLTIVIVDDPGLAMESFSQTGVAVKDIVKKMPFQTADSALELQIDHYQRLFDSARNGAEKSEYEALLNAAKLLNVDDVKNYFLYPDVTDGYFQPSDPSKNIDSNYIFIAAGEPKSPPSFLSIMVHNVGGKISYMPWLTKFVNFVRPSDTHPLNPEESYPAVSRFKRADTGVNGKDAGFRGLILPSSRTLGSVILHELMHNKTDDESEADRLVLNSIESAHKRKEKGDDSGYFLVLENKQKGFYVIT